MTPSKDLEPAIAYIKQSRGRYPRAGIDAQLRTQGWSPESIESAWNAIPPSRDPAPAVAYIWANRGRYNRAELDLQLLASGWERETILEAWQLVAADALPAGTAGIASPASMPVGTIGASTIVRVYHGKQQADAVTSFQRDAAMLARQGYHPTSQSWAQGQWGCGAFLVSILLMVLLVGFLIFLYLLIVKPDGTLTVTYSKEAPRADEGAAAVTPRPSPAVEASIAAEAAQMKTCPQCAEEVKAAAKICRFCRYEFEPQDDDIADGDPA